MKRLLIVYICLIVLTLLSAFISNIQTESSWIPVGIIMALVCIKFILVVLEYMEMRKSNRVWKISVILPAVLTALIIGIFSIV